MTLRAALACVAALAAGCGKRQPEGAAERQPEPAPAPPVPAPAPPVPEPPPPPRPPEPPPADAGLDAAAESAMPSALELRVSGYAMLLAIDVSLFQIMESYPGAPKGTTFETPSYRWRRPEWLALDAMQKEVGAILALTSTTPTLPADAPVQAYATKLSGWLPGLTALAAYYDHQKFVDDEFDRGRKESEDVRRTATELAKLRAPMRGAVAGAWRELATEYRDAPRGAVAYAWMACMSVADRVMEQAKPEPITRAVSECRRSIPKITELVPSSGFDADVRNAAVELGDWVAQGYPTWRTSVGDTLGKLTRRYLDLWPKLPDKPAEHPVR